MKSNRLTILVRLIALCLILLCVHCRIDRRGFEVVDEQGLNMGYGLCVTESRLYVTTNEGVEIYTKQPSGKLRHVESVDIGAPCFTINVQGDLAYTGGESGITALRLSGDHPTIAGRYGEAGTSIYKILVQDTLVFALDYKQGMTIVTAGNAAAFRTVTRVDLPQGSWDMKRVRDILYLAHLARGLLVLNISDPSKPIMLDPVESSRGARNVCISGDTLFLGTYNHGIKIYSLADPVRPLLLDSLFQPEEVGVFHVENGLLYCGWPERGVSVHLYGSQPPQEVAHFSNGLYHDGSCEDNLLYCVGRGIHILRLAP